MLRTLKQCVRQHNNNKDIFRALEDRHVFNNEFVDNFLHTFSIERTPVMQLLLSTKPSLDFTRNELDRLSSLVKGGDDGKFVDAIDDDTIRQECDAQADLIASIFESVSNLDGLSPNRYPSGYKKGRPECSPFSDDDINRITSVITLKAYAELVRSNRAILNQLSKLGN